MLDVKQKQKPFMSNAYCLQTKIISSIVLYLCLGIPENFDFVLNKISLVKNA